MTSKVRIDISSGCAVPQEPGAYFVFSSIVINALPNGSPERAITRARLAAARPRHRVTPPAVLAGRGR